jgi:hypothetical protein
MGPQLQKGETVTMSDEENVEMVDVVLKMPKPLVDFLKAVKDFTRAKESWEEMAVDHLVWCLTDFIEGNRIDELFPGFKGVELKKAYGLDKIDGY